MITIRRGNTEYKEEDKCPSCSSEVDKGGRMKAKKRTRWYLKCDKCKYTLVSEKTLEQKLQRAAKYREKQFKERLKINTFIRSSN